MQRLPSSVYQVLNHAKQALWLTRAGLRMDYRK
jgi:hypothetical protein